jgi:uncharacterized RDD family membrane protein YckC
MDTVQINTAFNVGLDFEIAPFYKRILAYLIDFVLLVIYLYCAKYFLYDVLQLRQGSSVGIDIVFISIPMLLYSLITELLLNGQTVGKKIVQIRAISIDGGEPTLGQFVLRWITKFFEWPFLFGYIYSNSIIFIWYFMITCFCGIPVIILVLATKNKQRLGDLAAGTTVVQTHTNFGLADTIFVRVNNDNYKVSFPQVMKLSDNDISTIKQVITQCKKTNNHDTSLRIEYRIKQVLQIESRLSSLDFLEKLLEDYNYLATKE